MSARAQVRADAQTARLGARSRGGVAVRSRRVWGLAAALLALSALSFGSVGPRAGTASANGVPGPLPTANPVPPVISIDTTDVRVAVTSPYWSFDRTGSALYVPVSWKPTWPLPAGQSVNYDVQARIAHPADAPGWGPWTAWLSDTPATSAHLTGSVFGQGLWTGSALELRARAVDPVTAETGQWSVTALSNIPEDDNGKNQKWILPAGGGSMWSSSWSTMANVHDFFGTDHTTTRATYASGGFFVAYGSHFAVFGTKCPACGKFIISLNPTIHTTTPWHTVDTYATSTHHGQLLYETTIPGGQEQAWSIDTLATSGRPRVSIDAFGEVP